MLLTNSPNNNFFDFDRDTMAEKIFDHFHREDWIDQVHIEAEPLDIIYDSNFNIVETLSAYINTYGLYRLVIQIITFGALISVLISLIVLLFTQKADMVREKKENIVYKIGLVLAASLSVFIFSVIKSFFDSLFGMI